LFKNKIKLFEFAVSLAITIGFVYLFYKVIGFKQIINFLVEINPFNLLVAFLLYFLSYITRTLRWALTLEIKNFFKLFKITVYNTIFNIFLPFRTGEISFFYMLKKENIKFSESITAFLSVRAFDGFALILTFVFFYLFYLKHVILALLIILVAPIGIHMLFKVLAKINIKKFKEFAAEKLSIKNILTLYVLSLLTLIFKFSGFYLVLPKSLSIEVSKFFLAAAAGDLTTVLPIHGIAGIGTYEGGFAGMLILFGVDTKLAVLSSVFVHIFLLLSSVILAVLVFLLSLFKYKN